MQEAKEGTSSMRSTYFNEGDVGDENDYREPHRPKAEPDFTVTQEELEELFNGSNK